MGNKNGLIFGVINQIPKEIDADSPADYYSMPVSLRVTGDAELI